MGFSRQEYWSGLLFPSPGNLPDPGIEPRSPALRADTLTSEPPGKPNSRHSPKSPLNMLLDRALLTRGSKTQLHPLIGRITGPAPQKTYISFLISLIHQGADIRCKKTTISQNFMCTGTPGKSSNLMGAWAKATCWPWGVSWETSGTRLSALTIILQRFHKKRKKKGPEKLFEEITAEDFPNMRKEMVTQVQEEQRIP